MSTLSDILCRLGHADSERSTMVEERDNEIARLYTKEHWTLQQIAEEADMQRSSIGRILERNGVAKYNRGRPPL